MLLRLLSRDLARHAAGQAERTQGFRVGVGAHLQEVVLRRLAAAAAVVFVLQAAQGGRGAAGQVDAGVDGGGQDQVAVFRVARRLEGLSAWGHFQFSVDAARARGEVFAFFGGFARAFVDFGLGHFMVLHLILKTQT